MSRIAQLAKARYDAGLWPEAYVRQLADDGRITEDEYREIVGKGDGPSAAAE